MFYFHTLFNLGAQQRENGGISPEHFRLGYQECLSEVMRYLVEAQGCFPRDSIWAQLVNHLHHHCDNIMKGIFFSIRRFTCYSTTNYVLYNMLNIQFQVCIFSISTYIGNKNINK